MEQLNDILVQVHERFVNGDEVGAEDLFGQYLPLIRYDQQPNFVLGIRKEILRRRGAIVSAHVRSPGPRVGREELNEVDRFLALIEVQAQPKP